MKVQILNLSFSHFNLLLHTPVKLLGGYLKLDKLQFQLLSKSYTDIATFRLIKCMGKKY